MGPDNAKQFTKRNGDKIPAGENVLAGIIAETKGGAWRRGLKGAVGPMGSYGHQAPEKARDEARQEAAQGESASWPAAARFWLILTDKQLHVFEGTVNSYKLGSGEAHYPLDRIAKMDYDKKLLISKLTVVFGDGSEIELDVAKQKVQPFIDAIASRG